MGTFKILTCTHPGLVQHQKLTPYANFHACCHKRRDFSLSSWTIRQKWQKEKKSVGNLNLVWFHEMPTEKPTTKETEFGSVHARDMSTIQMTCHKKKQLHFEHCEPRLGYHGKHQV